MPTTPILASSKYESAKKNGISIYSEGLSKRDNTQLPRVDDYSQQEEKVHTDST